MKEGRRDGGAEGRRVGGTEGGRERWGVGEEVEGGEEGDREIERGFGGEQSSKSVSESSRESDASI